MIKVLFCSPFLDSPKVIKGGINTWGRYVIDYYKQYDNDDVILIPVSFDRYSDVQENQFFIKRILRGLRDYAKAIKTSVSIMNTECPQVLHICTSASLGLFRDWFLLHEARKRGIKTIVHLHFGRIPFLAELDNWEWKLLLKLLHVCTIPIVMNYPSQSVLINEGFYNVKYLPNPLGMDVLNTIERLKNQYNRVPRRLLYCGHVLRTKGMLELVEGCSRIPNIELRVVGKFTDDIKNDMISCASKIKGDSSWMSFIGEVSHDSVIKEFLQADMFVFPSYTEGFPNVILEAMACGCPIVASDVGAIPEMLDIDNEACGICFKSHSADEVFRTVSFLIDNPELKQAYSSKAMQRIKDYYTINKVWKRLIDIWKN